MKKFTKKKQILQCTIPSLPRLLVYNNIHLAAQTYCVLFQIYKYIPNIQIYTKYTPNIQIYIKYTIIYTILDKRIAIKETKLDKHINTLTILTTQKERLNFFQCLNSQTMHGTKIGAEFQIKKTQ